MNRSQFAWSRYGRNSAGSNYNSRASAGSDTAQNMYDQDDDMGGGGLGSSAWVVAEACKVKDALFLGNVMAVQDSNFLVMNKIAYCIKCQTGFSVPQTLKRVGVNYAVINLLGAFMDQELPVQTKDTLLDNFYNIMESATEQGVGVLLYSFQDLAWCCFAVMAYWVRKYKWTVSHAHRIMKSRRPGPSPACACSQHSDSPHVSSVPTLVVVSSLASSHISCDTCSHCLLSFLVLLCRVYQESLEPVPLACHACRP